MIATLVGSRGIEDNIGKRCTRIGYMLADLGVEMYSGKAPGADLAFYQGYLLWSKHNKKPVKVKNFLPWKGFSGHIETKHDVLIEDDEMVRQSATLVSKIHPAWFGMKNSHKLLHLRNGFQVFGPDLRTAQAEFCLFVAPEIGSTVLGGTATAVNMFRKFGLPNHNLFGSKKSLLEFLACVMREDLDFFYIPDFEEIGGDVKFWVDVRKAR